MTVCLHWCISHWGELHDPSKAAPSGRGNISPGKLHASIYSDTRMTGMCTETTQLIRRSVLVLILRQTWSPYLQGSGDDLAPQRCQEESQFWNAINPVSNTCACMIGSVRSHLKIRQKRQKRQMGSTFVYELSKYQGMSTIATDQILPTLRRGEINISFPSV